MLLSQSHYKQFPSGYPKIKVPCAGTRGCTHVATPFKPPLFSWSFKIFTLFPQIPGGVVYPPGAPFLSFFLSFLYIPPSLGSNPQGASSHNTSDLNSL